jgi:hypothetical protein
MDAERFRRATAGRHRSSTDYERLAPEQLVAFLAVMEFHARWVVVAFLDGPDRDPEAVYGQAAAWAYWLRAEHLQRLHERGADREVLEFLVFVWCELALIHSELRRRLKTLPVGQALLNLNVKNAPEDAREYLLKALRSDSRLGHLLRPHKCRSAKEDEADLEEIALVYLIKAYRDAQERAVDGLPFPSHIRSDPPPNILARLPEDRERLGDRVLAWTFREEWKAFMPVLRGDTEKLAEAVRQHLREHYRKGRPRKRRPPKGRPRKWRAKKRQGQEIELDASKHAPTPRGDLGAQARRMEALADVSRYYDIASQQWGERARVFLDALRAGQSITHASRDAGVSRKTGHKYLRELKRLKND